MPEVTWFSLQADLLIIASDQFQLQQVFLNLINNAIGAIGKDGKIEIASRKVDSLMVSSGCCSS